MAASRLETDYCCTYSRAVSCCFLAMLIEVAEKTRKSLLTRTILLWWINVNEKREAVNEKFCEYCMGYIPPSMNGQFFAANWLSREVYHPLISWAWLSYQGCLVIHWYLEHYTITLDQDYQWWPHSLHQDFFVLSLMVLEVSSSD